MGCFSADKNWTCFSDSKKGLFLMIFSYFDKRLLISSYYYVSNFY
jgi:hypothetical protein